MRHKAKPHGELQVLELPLHGPDPQLPVTEKAVDSESGWHGEKG